MLHNCTVYGTILYLSQEHHISNIIHQGYYKNWFILNFSWMLNSVMIFNISPLGKSPGSTFLTLSGPPDDISSIRISVKKGHVDEISSTRNRSKKTNIWFVCYEQKSAFILYSMTFYLQPLVFWLLTMLSKPTK